MSQTATESFEWLNKAFFEKVIKHSFSDDAAEVTEFAIQSGSKAGENFASDLLRASINYTTPDSNPKSISVIIKLLPSREEGIDSKRLFTTEKKMYSETLIDINRVLLNAYDTMKLFPR